MKKKYKLKISYDGNKFHGWAKQPNVNTIQGEIEKILEKLFNKKVIVVASGRTDKFVHALNQIMTIETKAIIKKIIIKKALNKIDGLKIKKISLVDFNFSPRFNAIKKKYIYKIQTSRKKLKNEYAYHYYRKLNLDQMKYDSKKMIGEKNFASFTGKTTYQNYVRTVYNIKIYKKGTIIFIEITGKGFLRFMVRNIVGALIAKNTDKYSLEKWNDLFDFPEKGKVNYKAPGCGLYLKKVYF